MPAAQAGKIEVVLLRTKETPGTFRYDATDPDAVVPNIYIKKKGFEGVDAPHEITITATWE